MFFSNDQLNAINACDSNYIISAGAGSGKTEVLTERIYRLAKKDGTLDKFLVLTFTKLAAGEMKARVRKKLLNDPETQYLATEVDNAHIETFDSFSFFLVKKYFYKLDISKDISLVDETIIDLKRKQILDEVFNLHYEKHDIQFESLIKEYCVKDDGQIKNLVLMIISKADKSGDNFKYIEELKNNFSDDLIVEKCCNDFMAEIKNDAKHLLSIVNNNGFEDVEYENKVVECLENILNTTNYNEFYNSLLLSSFPSAQGKKATSDTEFRKAVQEYYKKYIALDKKVNYGTFEDIRDNFHKLKPLIQTALNLALEVETRVFEYKTKHACYSFGDVARFVLKLLNDDQVRSEIKNSLNYIMVDEFQDTNDIQDEVISKISSNNVYMVGDVKQSIYKFRGADCHIFEEKSSLYKNENGGKQIDLTESYRSRSEIVNFINEVFSKIMTVENNIIDYSKGHEFKFGQKAYLKNDIYKPEIYNYSFKNTNDSIEKEVNIIINDILKKIRDEFPVYDKSTNTTRPCSYKDFAIIIDRKTNFDAFRKSFSNAGIPLKDEGKEELFSSDVIVLVKSLIRMLYFAINNDYGSEYKHAFMSVARSFLYSINDDELHEIITKNKCLTIGFAQKIELLKNNSEYKSIKQILVEIFEEFEIYDAFSKIGNYYANAHKLESILALADSLDKLCFTLEDFVQYFDEISNYDLDVDFKDNDKKDDAVTLINIHASKGLEYEIVYYSLLHKSFNNQELKTSFQISDKYGLIMPWVDNSTNLFLRLNKVDLKQQDFEEKIRLLYVALTRAKQKIIILNGNNEEPEFSLMKPTSANNLQDILNIAFHSIKKYYVNVPDENIERVETKKEEPKVEKIILKKISVDSCKLNKKRASKTISSDVDDSLLTFGKELHANLEMADFELKDTSYISSPVMKKYVNNVLNSAIFKNVKNDQIRHEFHFYDELNNVEGFIDALIVKENEIDIVDFKIKNISDKEYDKQLNVYKNFVKQYTDKEIKMFLLAAVSGEVREVK